MADFPLLNDGQVYEALGESLAFSRGTICTGSGSANTKGSWTELAAATLRDASGIYVNTASGTSNTDTLVDIGIGAAASEVVVIPNLTHCQVTFNYWASSYFPISIPAGSRIAARLQGTVVSSTVRVLAHTVSQGQAASSPLSLVTAYGATTADSGGISVDPGAVANTKGAYSEVTASTTLPIRALIIGLGNQVNTARTAMDGLLDVAIGAAASEVVVLPDLFYRASTNQSMIPGSLGPFDITIPAGTRLAVRAQCITTDATDRLFDVVLYGIC